jgi:hypothetical protein
MMKIIYERTERVRIECLQMVGLRFNAIVLDDPCGHQPE